MFTTGFTIEIAKADNTFPGTEYSFQALNLTDPNLRFSSQGVYHLTVRIPGATNLVSDPPMPFKRFVIIRRGRTGSGNAWSGGEIIFQGRQVTDRKVASQSPVDMLTFANGWWDLQQVVFQQRWQYTNLTGTVAEKYFSRVNLFQRYVLNVPVTAATQQGNTVNITTGTPLTLSNGDYVTFLYVGKLYGTFAVTVADSTHFSVTGQLGGAYSGGGTVGPTYSLQNNGDQVKEILAYAILCGVRLQVGTVDLAFPLPVYPVRGMTCADAIQLCLKPTPDAVCWIDDSTTPPTFHCRQRANLTPLTLPYADGTKHSSSDITPRPDLQVTCVCLQYQATNTINGVSVPNQWDNIYPVGANPQQVGALVCPIDLRGGTANAITIQVQADAFNPSDLDWWKQKKPQMLGYQNLTLVPNSIVVRDDAGNDITASYGSTPNAYRTGEIMPWMGVSVTEVSVSANFTYSETHSNGQPLLKVSADKPHTITTRVKLTNAPAGSSNYQGLTYLSQGETAPAGLEQYIYNSLAVLQYEGSHQIVEQDATLTPGVSTVLGPQYALNLSGGKAEWATMLATIQSGEIDFWHGQTTVNFGPAKHIAPADLCELLQFFRYRLVIDPGTLRTTGQLPATPTQLGGDTAIENTTNGNVSPSIQVVAFTNSDGTTTWLEKNSETGQFRMLALDNAGNPVKTQGAAYHALDDLVVPGAVGTESGGPGLTGRYRRIHYVDKFSQKQCLTIGLVSEPITDPDPEFADDDNTPSDIWLGGGGGIRYLRISATGYGDYFMATDPANPTAPAVMVAKMPEQRQSLGNETKLGVTYTYTYSNEQKRTSTWSGGSQIEVVYPAYQVGDYVLAGQANQTGVAAVDAATPLVDLTARVWERKYQQT